jgi:hypothetical protein
MRIYKYPITPAARFVLDLPEGAEVLDAQVQHGVVCLWAKVNPDLPKRQVRFALVGTGHDAPEHADYISTFQLHGGEFVFHLFQEVESPDSGAKRERAE